MIVDATSPRVPHTGHPSKSNFTCHAGSIVSLGPRAVNKFYVILNHAFFVLTFIAVPLSLRHFISTRYLHHITRHHTYILTTQQHQKTHAIPTFRSGPELPPSTTISPFAHQDLLSDYHTSVTSTPHRSPPTRCTGLPQCPHGSPIRTPSTTPRCTASPQSMPSSTTLSPPSPIVASPLGMSLVTINSRGSLCRQWHRVR